MWLTQVKYSVKIILSKEGVVSDEENIGNYTGNCNHHCDCCACHGRQWEKSGAFTYELKGNGTAIITGYDWKKVRAGEDIYIPRMLDGYTVTEIGEEAFAVLELDENGVPLRAEDKDATQKAGSLIIPDTIVTIGARAFMGVEFTSASITIPASVQHIGAGAFSDLKNIKQFAVADGNAVYATIDGILYNKVQKELVAMPKAEYSSDSKTLMIPEGIRAIGDYAFFGWFDWSWKLCLPSTLEKIGNYAFANASVDTILDGKNASAFDINKWIFPQSLKVLGKGAFYDNRDSMATDMSKALLNNTSIEKVAEYTFFGVDFEELKLPQQLETIGAYAFSDCMIREQIQWPNSLAEIDDYAFYNASFGVAMDNVDIDMSRLTSLKRIGTAAFADEWFILGYSDKGYTENAVSLPHGVEEIGKNAFYNPNVVSINLPASLVSLGDDVCVKYQTVVSVEPGTYAAVYASENGYNTQGAGTEDTSWLN